MDLPLFAIGDTIRFRFDESQKIGVIRGITNCWQIVDKDEISYDVIGDGWEHRFVPQQSIISRVDC